MMLNWWLDFSITRRMCAGDDEFDEHSSLLIRWFADIELSSSRLHASLFKEELGGKLLPIFSKKEVLSSEGSSPSSSEHTLSNATTSKKDVDVDVFTLARDCCGEIFLRVFEKDVWKRQPFECVSI